MPRKKLSEFCAKNMVSAAFGQKYTGWSIDTGAAITPQLAKIPSGRYAVKVDQAVKGRFKKGLVLLDIPKNKLAGAVRELKGKGYRWLLAEPMVAHTQGDERYMSVARERQGLRVTYSRQGGVDVDMDATTTGSQIIPAEPNLAGLSQATGLTEQQLQSVLGLFESEHLAFVEINPYLVTGAGVALLDLAIEADDAGAFFARAWQPGDFRQSAAETPEEQAVAALAEKSPASFKLDVINPDGAIFLLLSGGGASIVVADEVHNLGYGGKLANYGEYSGNPNAEETFLYTSAVLSLLVGSKAPKKVLFIGGAVANFTDIANTFSGVIKALDAHAGTLKRQKVKVFVRRGGPRQEIGLKKIETALRDYGLLGAVYDPSQPLTGVVAEAVGEIA